MYDSKEYSCVDIYVEEFKRQGGVMAVTKETSS
jgi:hypothetical protein